MPAFELNPFHDAALQSDDLLSRLAWLHDVIAPRLERYLGYYRNATTELAAALACAPNTSFGFRPFRQFQELGLPARITGFRRSADGGTTVIGALDIQRKEVVIENDIAWRINTLVDFVAGRPPAVTSTARDSATRERLTQVINNLLQLGEQAGSGPANGAALLQTIILQGAIFGSTWIHLRPSTELLARLAVRSVTPQSTDNTIAIPDSGTGAEAPDQDIASNAAAPAPNGNEPLDVSRWLSLEVVEATRLCPLGNSSAAAKWPMHAPAYVAVLRDHSSGAQGDAAAPRGPATLFDRVRSWFRATSLAAPDETDFSFDIFSASHWQSYAQGLLAEEGGNPMGVVPFVRFENAADPAAGCRVGAGGSGVVDAGLGEVEPLMGLQDELNTRLSDRASRVTMTCFRMYLGRGIDDFTNRPIGPGQMWATDNPSASIESFGGDSSMPSEESHINEVREALDKISGVSPVAAGLVRGKLGNLTSAVALRLTLIALLARTERKRAALNQTLSAIVRMALEVLDRAGLVKSNPEDRGIDVNWPTALPESDIDRLQEAQAKLALGVPRAVVLTELGYGELTLSNAAPAAPDAAATKPQ